LFICVRLCETGNVGESSTIDLDLESCEPEEPKLVLRELDRCFGLKGFEG
jgi:hypothetical protein